MASWPGVRLATTSGLSPSQLASSTMMPSWSSPRPSSRCGADHAVGDVAVGLAGRDLERRRAAPPPGRTTTTRSPALEVVRAADDALGVPSVSLWPFWPTSTVHQLIVLPFFCGSGVTSSTRPTTSGPAMSPPCSPSSSRPTWTRLAAMSRTGGPRRHVGVARAAMTLARASDLHPELRAEAHVSLDDVVHVADPVAQHERRARCPGRTRSRCSGRGRCRTRCSTRAVDHAAAAHLDPARCHRRCGSPGPRRGRSKQRQSISALGSVNGKYDGRSRVTVPSPNSRETKASRLPLRWAIVMPSSTARPSNWWNTGVCVASSSSVRNTLPGQSDVDRRARARAWCAPAPARCGCAARGRPRAGR